MGKKHNSVFFATKCCVFLKVASLEEWRTHTHTRIAQKRGQRGHFCNSKLRGTGAKIRVLMEETKELGSNFVTQLRAVGPFPSPSPSVSPFGTPLPQSLWWFAPRATWLYVRPAFLNRPVRHRPQILVKNARGGIFSLLALSKTYYFQWIPSFY